MRDRDRILGNLESVYRGAFDEAERRSDGERMERLDFGFQRDQLLLEVLLDVRDMLAAAPREDGEDGPSILDRAKALKNLTRLR